MKVLQKTTAVILAIVMLVTSVPLQGFKNIEQRLLLESVIAEAAESTSDQGEEIVHAEGMAVELSYDAPATDAIGELLTKNQETIENFKAALQVLRDEYENEKVTVPEIIKSGRVGLADNGNETVATYGASLSAQAELADDAGTVNDTIFWSFSAATKTLTISGTGEIPPYYPAFALDDPDINDGENPVLAAPWDAYLTVIEKLEIGDGITAIGDYNFFTAINLTDISFSEGLQRIGEACFCCASKVKTLSFPTTLESIGDMVFYYAMSLENLYLNEGLTELGDACFANALDYKNLTIPSTLECENFYATAFGEGNFSIAGTTDVILEAYSVSSEEDWSIYKLCVRCVTEYGLGFYNNFVPDDEFDMAYFGRILIYALNEELNLGLPSIDDDEALIEFVNSIELVIGQITDSIKECADENFWVTVTEDSPVHEKCKEMYINHKVGEGEEACHCFDFEGKISDTISWTLDESSRTLTISGSGEHPENDRQSYYLLLNRFVDHVEFSEDCTVSDIGLYAFADMDILSVTIPGSVEIVKSSAFANCKNLSSVTFLSTPDVWRAIWPYAFNGCESLKTLDLPESVNWLSDEALCGSSLESVTIRNKTCQIGNTNNPATIPEGTVIYCYEGSTADVFAQTNDRTVEYIADVTPDMFEFTVGPKDGYDGDVATLTGYTGDVATVTIPAEYNGVPVVAIGDSAFKNKTQITAISLPDSITEIGRDAFYGCKNLKNVYAKDAESWLGISFGGSTGNPLYKGGNLYFGEELVTNLVIPDGVTSIKDYAFDGCQSLTSITIPGSVTSIGRFAFYGCKSLTSITILDGVISIGDNAFYGCQSLTSITIPGSVTNIGNYAFYGCENLTSVYAKDAESWLGISFGGSTGNPLCNGGDLYFGEELVTNLVIPDGVTSIGYYAFYGCQSLTSVTIPGSVTKIGSSAFSDCQSLASITIFDGVTSIGYDAFYGCRSLTSITIPGSVTNIGNYAFYGCENLKSVYAKDAESWLGISFDGWTGNPLYNGGNLYFGEELVTNLVIPDGVTSIKNYAFYGYQSLTSITIPGSVTNIGNYAFYGCENLKSVYAKDAESWLGISFGGSTGNPLCNGGNLYFGEELVTNLVIPDGVTSIKNYAFYGCKSLTNVTIAADIESMGNESFRNCSNLKEVTIFSTVKTIGKQAFYECSALADFYYYGTNVNIGYDAFALTADNIILHGHPNLDLEKYATNNGFSFEVITEKELPEILKFEIVPEDVCATYFDISAVVLAKYSIASISIEYALADGDFVPLCTQEYSETHKSEIIKERFDVSGLASGVYTVKIVVTDSLGNETELAKICTVDTTPPAMPADFDVKVISGGLHLSWVSNIDDDFKHYKVYRCSTEDGIELIATSKTGSFNDYKFKYDIEYTYRVTAVDNFGNESEAAISEGIVMVKSELVPQSFEITSPEKDQTDLDSSILLKWTKSLNVSHYNVFLWEDGKEKTENATYKYLKSTSCAITLKKEMTYHVCIQAVNGFGVTTTDEIVFTVTKGADLCVSEINVAQEAVAASDIVVSWTVENQGKRSTGSSQWTDIVYLCASETFDTESVIASATVQNVSYLNVGEKYQSNATLRIPKNITGTYYVFVVTDKDGKLNEFSSENNILRSNAVNITLPPSADLSIVSLQAGVYVDAGENKTFVPKTEIMSDTTIIVRYTVENTAADTVARLKWVDKVYLCSADGSDSRILHTLNVNYYHDENVMHEVLHEDGNYTYECYVGIPEDVYGDYQIKVCVDVFDKIDENLEGNNEDEIALNVTLRPPADLTVDDIEVPDKIVSGKSFSVSWIDKNVGSGSLIGKHWTDKIYVSQNPEFDIKTATLLTTIESGFEDLEHETSIWLPLNYKGVCYLHFEVDSKHNIFEYKTYDNNIKTLQVDVTQGNLPELEVKNVTVSGITVAGEKLDVCYTISNTGKAVVLVSDWTDEIYLVDAQGKTEKLKTVKNSQTIRIGEDINIDTSVQIPEKCIGEDYCIQVVINANNAVAESADNNTATSDIFDISEHRDVDLEITTMSVTRNMINKSEPIVVTYGVKNNGTHSALAHNDAILLSTSPDYLENTIVVKTKKSGTVAPGKEYFNTFEFFLPSAVANGTYYITACANYLQELPEADFSNNSRSGSDDLYCYIRETSDLAVTAITIPETVGSGANVRITYTVSNMSFNKTYESSWEDKIYIADADTASLAQATLLKTVTIRNSLSTDNEYQQSVYVKIPDGISGDYVLFVVNDEKNSNNETNTQNNIMISEAFNVYMSAYPDIDVEIIAPTEQFVAGQPIDIEYKITNHGSAETKATRTDTFDFVAEDGTVTKLATVTQQGVVAVDKSVVCTATVPIPATLLGKGKILLTVNSKKDEMYEHVTDNNTAELAMQVLPLPTNELTVCNVSATPESVVPGGNVTVSWELVNLSNFSLNAWLVDNIYISADDQWDDSDILVTQHERKVEIEASESDYTSVDFTMLTEEQLSKIAETRTDAVPGVETGGYYLIVRTDVRNQINEPNENNNTACSSMIHVQVQELELNKTVHGTLELGDEAYYKVHTQAGQTLFFSGSAYGGVDIYISANKVPTPSEHDYQYTGFSKYPGGIAIPYTQSGDYYICVRALDVYEAQSFNLTVSELDYGVQYVTPSEGGRGKTTIKLVGALFSANMQVYLTLDDRSICAEKVYFIDASNAYATFDLSYAAYGSYGLKVVSSQGEITYENMYTVRNLPQGELVYEVDVASQIRLGNTSIGTVTYRNVGYTDVYAPTFCVVGENVKFKPADSEEYIAEDLVFGQNDDGLAGILAHGEGGTYSFAYYCGSAGKYSINVYNVANNENNIVLNESSEVADIIKYNLLELLSGDDKEYSQSLALMAAYLDQFNDDRYEVADLESAFLMNAFSALLPSALGEQTDIVSRNISLSREYSDNLLYKYENGIFGKGWKSNYEIKAEYASDDDGAYIVLYDSNYIYIYRPDETGAYVSAYGGSSTARFDAFKNIIVTLENGVEYFFNSDGNCMRMVDLNGNLTELTYTDGLLTGISDSVAGDLSLVYTDGKVTQVSSATDTVSYTYDGDYLTSVTTAYGTRTYKYDTTSVGAQRGSLVQVRYEDGTGQHYFYDKLGRLTSIFDNSNTTYISYSAMNEVTIFTALGIRGERYCFDANGNLVRYWNGDGAVQNLSYNENGFAESVSLGLGVKTSYEYDENLNVSAVVAADGYKTLYTYDAYGNITSVTDKRGILTTYERDSMGNNTGIVYEDGSREQYTYDDKGNVITYTDRKGNVTTYEYNEYSDVTGIIYADGSFVHYEYDARGNMVKADENGEITLLTYTQRGELEKVLYPDGKSVHYTYDASGRLLSVTDGDGEGSYYTYDASGRVKTLSSKEKTETEYVYNADSSLQMSKNRNGTFTVYEYENGVQKSIYNYGADNEVMSYFVYTYDPMGYISAMETEEGTWSYEYDVNGQLIKAVSPANEVTEYTYDLSGNRTSVTVNGVRTEYTANRLNQYTTVGETVFEYDANGNMTSMTEADGSITTYSYDLNNRLVAVVGNDKTYKYTYDIFGLRNSVEQDGEKTVYVNSPDGAGDAIASYGSDGKTNYLHGTMHYMYNVNQVTVDTVNGLTAALKNGESYYYSYNHLGSTIDITDKTGIVVNSYTYNQEGAVTSRIETITNPYTYVGEYGIADDNNGLYYMRARFVSQTTDAFMTPDPAKQEYDLNLYRYAANNLIMCKDISGRYVDYDYSGGNPLIGIKTRRPASTGEKWGIAITGIILIAVGWWVYGLAAIFTTIAVGLKVAGVFLAGGGVSLLIQAPGYGADLPDGGDPDDPNGGDPDDPNGGDPDDPNGGDPDDPNGGEPGDPNGGEPDASDGGDCVAPLDPNDILGPDGYGDAKWIAADDTLAYTIRFENDAQLATAPVQKLVVTQTPDESIDLRSFRLVSFGFGEYVFEVPANTALYQTRVDMVGACGVYVDVFAGVDVVSGTITYTFTAIDPATGLQPVDPMVGFLPVNDENHIGEGFIRYTAKLKDNVATGTVVSAEASIVFDNNEAIDTPAIFNTVDTDAPVAALQEIRAGENGKAILVWESTDGEMQSGIRGVDIYVSENNGEFIKVASDVRSDAEILDVEPGKLYGFIVRATDNAGNTEPMETIAERTLDTGYTAVAPAQPVIKELAHNADGALIAVEAEENCSIFYTLDGSAPDMQSDKYFEAVFVPNDTTIRAVAINSEKTASDISAYYVEKQADPIVNVAGISLDKSSFTLVEGGSSVLVATVTPENATNKTVRWSSDNENVLVVDANGNITALAPGSAIITVTSNDGSFTAVCKVEVLCSHKSITCKETAPTCTAPGVSVYTCETCGYSYSEDIPQIDHADENGDTRCDMCNTQLEITVLLGDVDGNGEISSADARLALRASVGLDTLTAEQTLAADVNKDSEVTSADARLILRAAVGLEELNTLSV